MARTESRGAHSRIDFPELDGAVWGKKHNIIVKEGDAMVRREIADSAAAGRVEGGFGAGVSFRLLLVHAANAWLFADRTAKRGSGDG